jgi:toxin ParE1/3/4
MIIRPEAEADVANARDWYERQRAGLGAAFLLCVEEVLERISRTPRISLRLSVPDSAGDGAL